MKSRRPERGGAPRIVRHVYHARLAIDRLPLTISQHDFHVERSSIGIEGHALGRHTRTKLHGRTLEHVTCLRTRRSHREVRRTFPTWGAGSGEHLGDDCHAALAIVTARSSDPGSHDPSVLVGCGNRGQRVEHRLRRHRSRRRGAADVFDC